MQKKPILIGIAGGTGSGKTSVARAITKDFDTQDVALIEQDSYYHAQTDKSLDERTHTNYDHPSSMDFELMRTHIADLLRFEEVQVPLYDYSQHTRSSQSHTFKGQNVIVLEGIFALYDPELTRLMDIKIYVDAADDIRILRRMQRDIRERGRSFEAVFEQYLQTVRPMHLQFVAPTKLVADIIVPGGANNHVAIDVLRTKLREILSQK